MGRIAAAAVMILASVGPGCGVAPRATSLSAGAPALEGVRRLRRAHGGLETWNAHAGVRFRYRFRTAADGDWVTLPEVSFRRGDLRHLWVRFDGSGLPQRLELDAPAGALVAEIVAPAGGLRSALESESLAADFALRAIRYSFALPFTTATGGWEFRTVLRPPGYLGPLPFETLSLEPGAPHGACLLAPGSEGGLLERVLYNSHHPFLGGGPYLEVLDGYRTIGGVSIATHRMHSAQRRPPEGPHDPFPESGRRPATPFYLEERFDDIVLLDASAAEQCCPPPATTSRGAAADDLQP